MATCSRAQLREDLRKDLPSSGILVTAGFN